MKIHKEGYTIILITFTLIGFIASILGYINIPYIMLYFSWVFLFLFFIWIVRFFRYPIRKIEINENTIYSPCDGKIVIIEKIIEPEFFKDERMQISIFMSPNNVHVNWSPISGIIKYYKYHKGKYLVAWHPKSSTKNERTTIVVETERKQQILIRQIAGAVARRIVCYCNKNNLIRQGDEIGFIKFGSRVDLFLPLNCKINVQLNEKVKGKITEIANF